MKKIIFAIYILSLLCILTGCPTDTPEPDPEPTKSMTFIDDLTNPSKEFLIDENLYFKVTFLSLGDLDPEDLETLQQFGLRVGLEVWGNVFDTEDSWVSDTITGKAREMRSNSEEYTTLLGDLDLDMKFTYNWDKGEIIEVVVSFPKADEDYFSKLSQILMGGTYTRIE